MASKKAIFYFNVRNESGHLYSDVQVRIAGWETKVRDFLGKDYDVLVVPVLNKESELVFTPNLDPAPTLGTALLNEDVKPSTKASPKTE